MEFVLKILLAAVALGALVTYFVSFFVAAHSFVALLSTAYAPETSGRKKLLLQLVPFLIVTPLVQPPEKKRYADRFAYSMGGLSALFRRPDAL